jgi:Holliday junction resolvase
MVLLREIEVENILRESLKKDGFTVVPRVREQGVDIIARKNNVSYYIEVEGNKKPDGIRPLTTSQKYTHYFRAIGQLAFRISEYSEGQFILALPEDKYYQDKVDKTMPAFRKLGVIVYFVTTDGLEVIE